MDSASVGIRALATETQGHRKNHLKGNSPRGFGLSRQVEFTQKKDKEFRTHPSDFLRGDTSVLLCPCGKRTDTKAPENCLTPGLAFQAVGLAPAGVNPYLAPTRR
jgi:hypothetical protein